MAKFLYMMLLAVGIGYIVCASASKEKGSSKSIGYLLGIAIIAGALVLSAGKACLKGNCKIMKKMMYCGKGPQQMVESQSAMKPPTK